MIASTVRRNGSPVRRARGPNGEDASARSSCPPWSLPAGRGGVHGTERVWLAARQRGGPDVRRQKEQRNRSSLPDGKATVSTRLFQGDPGARLPGLFAFFAG